MFYRIYRGIREAVLKYFSHENLYYCRLLSLLHNRTVHISIPVARSFTQALKRQVCFVHLAQVSKLEQFPLDENEVTLRYCFWIALNNLSVPDIWCRSSLLTVDSGYYSAYHNNLKFATNQQLEFEANTFTCAEGGKMRVSIHSLGQWLGQSLSANHRAKSN